MGNANISSVNGALTIADISDSQSTIILLNSPFAYELSGSDRVGLAYANGTIAVNFSLAEGPVVIEPHELYTADNKTVADALSRDNSPRRPDGHHFRQGAGLVYCADRFL